MRKTSFGQHPIDQVSLIPAWKVGDHVELLRGGVPIGVTGTVQQPSVAGNNLLCWVRVDSNIIDSRYARALLQVPAVDLRVFP